MLKKIRMAMLKREARVHYLACEKILDGMSCGRHLAEHISVDYSEHRQKFNAAMDKLAALDSNAPTTRL